MSAKNIFNRKKYSLKEDIAFNKTNKRFQDALDSEVLFTDDELDILIEDIIKNSDSDTYLQPFSTKIIPKGNNKTRTKKLFYNKKYYDEHAFPKAQKQSSQDIIDGSVVDDQSKYQGESRNVIVPFHTIDFNYQKAFYGRIDTQNRSIYPSEKFLKLVSGTDDVFLLNFVSDAANDMIAKIEKMKESGKISKDSIFYDFKVVRGWTSFTKEHHRAMERIYQGFVSRFANDRTNNITISKFSEFSKHFVAFLSRFLSKFPISRTNLQLRRTTNPRVSGIVFEISRLKHDDDKKKYTDYILDKHFLQIQNIANGYGFMVDRNAPWRFTADLESPQMRHRMEVKGFGYAVDRYDIDGNLIHKADEKMLQRMFDTFYYKAHLYEVNSLKTYFYSYYDSYVESYPYYTETYKCGEGAKAKVVYRKKREKDPFTDKKLLEYYYFIRAKEAFKDWNQETFDICLEEAHQVFNHYGFIEALNHINDKTSHVYGRGGNPGVRTKKDEKNRIFFNHQPSYKRNNFSIII